MNPILRHLLVRRPAIAALGLLPLGVMAAAAQPTPGQVPYLNLPPVTAPATPPGGSAYAPSDIPAAKDASTLEALKQREQELATMRAEQRRALENEDKLKREIEAIGADRRKLNAQLIETAARVRSMEAEIARTADRLAPLDEREQALLRSLDGRRGVLVEVLAVLQRMGRHPPSVMMVRPEDALQALRTAMLLGSVLPELRQETDALIADLSELARLRKGIAEARERLDRDLKTLADESPRLALLVEQRQKQQAEIENTLTAERRRATQLARQVDNLKDLIGGLERDLDSATRAARLAARPPVEKKSLDNRRDALPCNRSGKRVRPIGICRRICVMMRATIPI